MVKVHSLRVFTSTRLKIIKCRDLVKTNRRAQLRIVSTRSVKHRRKLHAQLTTGTGCAGQGSVACTPQRFVQGKSVSTPARKALSAGQGLGGALHALSLQNKSRLVLSARCHAVVAERAGVLQLPP